MDDSGLELLKQEMQSEEINVKVNAIHRLKLVILSIGKDESLHSLIPYLRDLVRFEDDEVLYAIAEEIAKVFPLLDNNTAFLPLLNELAAQSETVVRDQATKTMTVVCEQLSDHEVQNVFAPIVVQLAQGNHFSQRQSSCNLFQCCYKRSGIHREKLRKLFIELCNEDTPMVRRTCATKLGQFTVQVEKQHVIQDFMPVFKQLSQDEQDAIRVMCLESLIPIARYLTKEENQLHTLGTLLSAGEDKSWKVRLCFAKNFAEFSDAFGQEITNNSLIQTFALLLSDNESEVRNAAIKNMSKCLKHLSTDKISNLLLPTLQSTFADSSPQFKAGVAGSVCEMAEIAGKPFTVQKIYPMLLELLKEDNSEVKLAVVQGMSKIARVVGSEILNGMNTS